MIYSVNWFPVLTAVVAIDGAALSTYTFVVNRHEKRRVLTVKAGHALAPDGRGDTEELMIIDVSNPGFQNVTVLSVSIELPNQKQLVIPYATSDRPIPCELTPGAKLSVLYSVRAVAAYLHDAGLSGTVKLVPACRDALGTTYRGKELKFNMEQWLQA